MEQSRPDLTTRILTQGTRQIDSRDHGADGSGFWYSTYNWVKTMPTCPDYGTDMNTLDDWVIQQVERDPYMSGMVSKIVNTYSSRGWELTGGSRAVKNLAAILHQAHPNSYRLKDGSIYTNELKASGWRLFQKRKARSYLTRCRGVFVEVQHQKEPVYTRRGWRLSPLENFYNMDTTDVIWGADPLYPITYNYGDPWPDPSFYHLVAFPSDRDEYYRYGSSAAYRNIELSKILVAIHEWEQGTLDPHFMDGLLLLKGMTTEQFDQAMKARYDNLGNPAKRIAVLADPDVDLEAKLHILRTLPPTFERFIERVSFLLRGYALNFGFDSMYFFGAEGTRFFGTSDSESTSRESGIGESGQNEFHLQDQEMIQAVMPDTVGFTYQELDVDRRAYAELHQIQAKTLTNLFLAQRLPDNFEGGELLTIARARGPNLGTPEQFRQLMVEWNLVPPEWTATDENVNIDDLQQVRMTERVLSLPQSEALIKRVETGEHRDDQLVRYMYYPDTGHHGIDTVLPSIKRYLEDLPYYSLGPKYKPRGIDIINTERSRMNKPLVRTMTPDELQKALELIAGIEDEAKNLAKELE
jgi:hypothetical protein